MQTVINIGKRKEAIIKINKFSDYLYENKRIELKNTHLKNINNFYGKKIFIKNDCFIDSQTLWEIMQPNGKLLHHHSRGLNPCQIFEAFRGMKSPINVKESYYSRFIIITLATENNGYNLCVVVQPNVFDIVLERKINKIITIHPINKKM